VVIGAQGAFADVARFVGVYRKAFPAAAVRSVRITPNMEPGSTTVTAEIEAEHFVPGPASGLAAAEAPR
jgi:hypothetical protein